MSAEASVESAATNLNLTPDEKRLYGQLFRQADTGNAGVVTGEIAVKFFDKTRLDSRILGEIWQIADKENRGFLTPAGFGIVLRLIGHAQAGREPTTELAFQPGQLPRFDGFGPPQVGSPTPPPAVIEAQTSGAGAVRIPALTPEKVTQYGILFERQPLVNGNLPGDQAKQIFEKSGLPNEVLGRIWMLADTEQRGALVQTEFVIAMHLLTSLKTGALRALPNILPAALYEAATRRGPAAAQRPPPSTPGVSAIPRQMSGTAQGRAASPLGRPPISAQGTGADWAVAPGDKIKFDQIFADLDKGHKGYITGEEAVSFFSQSNLSEDALAQIWDLSDINSQGHLSKDEFAVAMYLIRQQRGNRSNSLPATLPPNLIPPSLRNQPRPQPPVSAFDAPPAPQHKSALDDLFGLQSSSSSPAPVTAEITGSSIANDPFAGGPSSAAPSSPIRPSATGSKFPPPFVPSSSFGRGLTGPGEPAKSQPSASDDLLGGDDAEESKNITSESTELANLSNQISSLAKQTQDTQTKRAATQNEFNQTNSQRQTFEQRLNQLRTLYEKEVEDTRALEESLRKLKGETDKLRGECMTLEGTYRDIQTQHQEVTTALQNDQQENTRLRERIRVVNGEIAQLKPQIDKLKSEARQQKGLVAINKKQLSTTEGERDKLKSEAEELTKSNEDISRQAPSSATASPTAAVVSPAASTASGNNPFFKRTASTDIMGAFASPPARSYTDNAFDDVFGPSHPAGSSATPPPPTSFKQQHTGASTASASSAPPPSGSSPVVSRQTTFAADPPAPPQSRQISSSFLPFPEHTESLSSSRQVSPPASRAEGSVGTDTPDTFTGDAVTAQASNLPGAFPGDEDDKDTPSATPAGPTVASPTEEGPKASDNPARASDPFAAMDNAKAKEEFDNAFAAFSSSNKVQDKAEPEGAKSKSAFDTEFPPISELQRDDDSDSESERGGFDDDFAPTLPDHTKTEQKPTESNIDTAFEPTEKSPEQASSPATITATSAGAAAPNKNVDDIFGAADSGSAQQTAQPTSSNNATKGAFDDLDDEFEGLEDAKEGSADDDFANISRSGLDDYNPMFDSSPPASQTKSESTAFGNESSFDFIPSNTSSGAPAPASGNQQKGAESHDWDAIFAGLDSPSTTAAAPALGSDVPAAGNGLAPPETRPSGPGRALTESGEHDDPILKDLLQMGYSRTDAVSALEKYDYNLEKAANHLASNS